MVNGQAFFNKLPACKSVKRLLSHDNGCVIICQLDFVRSHASVTQCNLHGSISTGDEVVEFAPGLGVTARMTLACFPPSYTAVERDQNAAAVVNAYITSPNQQCILGTAEETGLPDASASVVYGEAMLSMQLASAKERIIAEAARLLRPGGRYGIHELCLVPEDVNQETRVAIQRGLSDEIHVGVRPLTAREWKTLIEAAGLAVVAQYTAPMHLLEPARLIRDEGLFRAARFVWNVIRNPEARRRVRAMRRIFRQYRHNLAAIALVAVKPAEAHT